MKTARIIFAGLFLYRSAAIAFAWFVHCTAPAGSDLAAICALVYVLGADQFLDQARRA